MKSSRNSQAARRRAAAAAVAVASVGASILGTQSAEAEIVTINLGPTGFNITGVNGGVASGARAYVNSFPVYGIAPGNGLVMRNKSAGFTGVAASGNMVIAQSGGYANPQKFAAGDTISSTPSVFTNYGPYTYFKTSSYTAPIFGADSYLGFKTSQGNYGWLKATWDGTDFQLYSGAYESVVGVSIKAGDTGSSPVPEIDPSGLASAMSLVMGSVAMLEQRRRKRAAVAAESATVTA